MAAMNEVSDLLPDTVLLDYIRAQIPSNDKLWTFRKHLAVQYACQVPCPHSTQHACHALAGCVRKAPVRKGAGMRGIRVPFRRNRVHQAGDNRALVVETDGGCMCIQ